MQVQLPEQGPYQVEILQFLQPNPSTYFVARVLETSQAYSDTGKLSLFEKPKTLAPFPAKRFTPEPAELFGRIKTQDTRDSHESEVLWNIGNNFEVASAAFHQVVLALQAKDWTAVTQAISVTYHFHQSGYQRIQERVDFFVDSLESGKSESILLQKYLREEYRSYSSDIYCESNEAYAKEIVAAQSSSKSKAKNDK